MDARTAPFFVLSLLYLAPLIAEAIGGVKKARAGEPARWEGMLNLLLLPFVVVAAVIARPVTAWMPSWFVVVLLAVLVDVLGFLVWWATCDLAAKTSSS